MPVVAQAQQEANLGLSNSGFWIDSKSIQQAAVAVTYTSSLGMSMATPVLQRGMDFATTWPAGLFAALLAAALVIGTITARHFGQSVRRSHYFSNAVSSEQGHPDSHPVGLTGPIFAFG